MAKFSNEKAQCGKETCRKAPAHIRYQSHLNRTVLQHRLQQDLHCDHLKCR